MATVTWKGEPGAGDDEGPKSVTWAGKVFKKGEGVEVTDPAIIEKAKTNSYFEVSGDEPAREPVEYKPPSQQSAQGPVPKAGEPVRPIPPPPLAKPKV